MNMDTETPETDSAAPIEEPSPQVGSYVPPHNSSNRRVTLAMLGAVLLAGLVGGAWLMKSYGPRPVVAESSAAPDEGANIVVDPAFAAGNLGSEAPTGVAPGAEITYNRERIVELERRLSTIDVQAQAAGGNVSRAEGLLVAFAARRAIERGLALGYIENELYQRFGSTMPRAVQTIVDASKRPTTSDKLSEQLDNLSPQLLISGEDEGFWANARREVGQLFVVRSENSNYIAPDQRLARARRALDIGRVDRAIAEVEKLPGAEKAQAWLVTARRFNEAQRALDLIEYAAIQGPRAAAQQGLGAAAATTGAASSAPSTAQ